MTLINAAAIPAELKVEPRWVCWKYVKRPGEKKPTKPPFQTDGQLASVTDPSTWTSFDIAAKAVENGGDFEGIGFVLTGDGLVGFDFDHVLDKNGQITDPKIAAAVTELDSYTEVSPSGFGLRLLARGKLPPNLRRSGPIEMYDTERYLTLTGNVFPETPATINERQAEIDAVHAELLGKSTPRVPRSEQAPIRDGGLQAALTSEKHRSIYEADSLEKDKDLGYPSGSEADFALIGHLRLYGADEEIAAWLKASPRGARYRKAKFSRADYIARTTEGAAKSTPKRQTIAERERAAEIAFRGELFHDDRKDTYSHFDNQTLPIKGREFKRHVVDTYQMEQGKQPSADAVVRAISGADAMASRRGKKYKLDVRFAKNDDGRWLDLCDGRAVLVTPEGWQVVEEPPILFRRWAHQTVMPEPLAMGGDLNLINRFLNIVEEDDLMLVHAWVVTALVAGIPKPGVALHGPQGSGKSITAQALRQTTDPSAQLGQDLPTKPAELAQLLDHNAVPVFDNLTSIHDWANNMLCRAVTGEAFNKRELYSDADDIMFLFRRTFLVTGINIPTAAPDLLDRLILIGLTTPSHRVEESELLFEFEKARPAILGGLLDTLVKAMNMRSRMRVENPPRMADFARWGAAAAEALGYGGDRFVSAYRLNIARQNEEVIDNDPVASALISTIPDGWEGTMSALKAELERRNPDIHKSRSWPKDPAWLRKRLNVLAATLESQEVRVESFTQDKERRVRVKGTRGDPGVGY